MYIFIVLGLCLIIAPFLTNDLKKYSNAVKGIVFGLFFLLGGIFTYIGTSYAYEELFKEYPALEIKSYSDSIFKDFNLLPEKYANEDVLEISKESLFLNCDDEYCTSEFRITLFKTADRDTNGFVTQNELFDFIKSFDTNKDGFLNRPQAKIKTLFKEVNKSEFELFNGPYGPGYGKRIRKELLSK